MKPAPVLNKLFKYGIPIQILVVSISYFLTPFIFKLSAMFLVKLILLKLVLAYTGLDRKIEESKLMKKLLFILSLRKLKKQSKSINQTQTLLGKFLLDIPIKEDEDEVMSYMDIKNHYGDKWPFMHPVSNTRDPKVVVRGKRVECISSYSYLDLCRDERVQEAAIQAAKLYSTGNHGPRMLCGNLEILENLEKRLAKFLYKEAALVFSSGYLACMSCVSGIARKGDVLLMDKLCHASLKAGAKLSGAKIVYFKHNDFKDAEKQIKANKYNKLIMVIEGVYSMDGDIGNLPEARRICDKYGAILMLDEAHSLGAIGERGKGAEEFYGYKYFADIVCGSFTKSLASVGGYIACSQNLREFYTFYGQGVVFSAPLSAYHAGAADKALEIIENEPQLIKKQQENSQYLRDKFRENGFNIGDSVTCVLPVIFRDTIQTLNMHAYLLAKGYFTSLVMAPACPVTAPRFRITVSCAHTKQELDNIINIFIEARKACPENSELRELLDGLPL